MCRCLVRAPRLPLLATPPPLPLPTSLLPGLPAPPSHVHKATSSPSVTEAVQGVLDKADMRVMHVGGVEGTF